MKKLELSLSKYQGCLSVRTDINNETPVWADTRIGKNEPWSMTFGWVLSRIRDTFYSMPYDNITLKCTQGFAIKHKDLVNSVAALIDNTNNLLQEYKHLKEAFTLNNNVLFVNVSEDLRYGSLYQQLQKVRPDMMHYLNTDVGFDRVNRVWGERNILMPISDLVDYLKENKIGKIVTVNYYFTDTYTDKLGINLMAFLRFIGVEHIIINNDPPDLRTNGYLFKVFNSIPEASQFCNMAELNEWWDNYYNLRNISYCAIPQNYKDSKLMERLPGNYDIVVLSNSRLSNVEASKGAIDLLLPVISGDNPYINMQLWYMATRHLILNILDITELERLIYCSLLHQFYFTIAQYFKHRIVRQIKTNRKVHVYGDIGWQQVCPDLYRGSLDNGNIDKLFAENNHLYLLFNFSLSYLDASAPVYDMIRRGVPFINVPPIAKTPELEGLSKIEYTDATGMNNLLNDYNSIIDDPALKSSLARYRELLMSSTNRIEATILNSYNEFPNIYTMSLDDHNIKIKDTIINYLSKNEAMIRESFRALFGGNS